MGECENLLGCKINELATPDGHLFGKRMKDEKNTNKENIQ